MACRHNCCVFAVSGPTRRCVETQVASRPGVSMKNQLEEKEMIRTRKAQYCRFLDTKQFEQWEKLFNPGAKITFYGVDSRVLMLFDSFEAFASLTRDLF